MAPLKIPLQVSCPNCQAGNLPGSPYCSRCGAPLSDAALAAAGPRPVIVAAPPEDPLKKLVTEGQDPVLVKQSYERASAILTTGEVIEYVAIAGKGNITHAPDCAVATNKRLMLYKKKVLGKVELDDCYWRDVREASMKDGRNGVSLILGAIQGWNLAVDGLPKAQAWRLYEIACQHGERLQGSDAAQGLMEGGQAPTAAPVPIRPSTQSVVAATMSSVVPQMPYQGSGTTNSGTLMGNPTGQLAPNERNPTINLPTAPLPTSPLSAQHAGQGFVPTPESVLQSILQQSQGLTASGAPTRPMQFSAAAFQAPALAEAQPVVFRDTDTEPNMRTAPPLPTLEQIAVFSGPLGYQNSQSPEAASRENEYQISDEMQTLKGNQISGAHKPGKSVETTGFSASDAAPKATPAVPVSRPPLRYTTSGALADLPQYNGEHDSSYSPDFHSGPLADGVFGALPSSPLPQFTEHGVLDGDGAPVGPGALSVNSKPESAEDVPMQMGDIMNIMLPPPARVQSGPLPMPGSLTSGPLLSGRLGGLDDLDFSDSADGDDDTGSLATQRLDLEGHAESDADRPTDINLGQYDVPTTRAPRKSKSSAAPKAPAAAPKSPAAKASTPASRPAAKSNADDPMSKLKQLKMLLDAGLITQEDYEGKKVEILSKFF
ncbi:MAG: PH domain-containing protein [Chloroflexota bacterium]